MTNSKLSIQSLCTVSLCTAVIAIMAQISIPMPFGVPLTMQTFAVALTAIILGSKKGALASFIYVLLGAAGVPVLSNFTGGYQHFAGPTGGFLISFPVMAFIIGLCTDKYRSSKAGFITCLAAGFVLNYICGIIWFCLVMHSSPWTAFTVCVLPFLPMDIVKAVLSAVIGVKIQGRLLRTISI